MRTAATAALWLLVLVAALAPGRAAAAPGLLIGVDDDTAKWLTRPNGIVAVDRDLGLGAVRITIPWQRGEAKPTRLQQTYLHRASLLMALGERVVLAVYGTPANAPTTTDQRDQYCAFLTHVATRLPVRDVVVWNEANSSAYWPASSGAAGYEQLLATCWDALHARRPSVNVISSTAAHHDPAGFVVALGAAYRASARTRPIADTFGHNPYPDTSAEPPYATHSPDSGTIGEGDLPLLLAAYRTAFAGTAQPLPGSGGVTIWYLEDGFQTTIPSAKLALYHGSENDRAPVPAVSGSSTGALSATRDQATQLRDALLLAYCQPEVGAFFNFELIDESRLGGWQSGVLWRDGTRKPSYEPFKQTVATLASRSVDCTQVPGASAG
jgi:hypothetical protein